MIPAHAYSLAEVSYLCRVFLCITSECCSFAPGAGEETAGASCRANARFSLWLHYSERLQYLDKAGTAGQLLLYVYIWQKPAVGLTETRIVVGLVIAIGKNNR